MKLIIPFFERNQLSRLQRVVIIGLPSMLILLSQVYVTPELFKSIVTVTALISALTPLARGGAFHHFKLVVLSGEKLSIANVYLFILCAGVASVLFGASLIHNSQPLDVSPWLWIEFSSIGFLAFVSLALIETYFYEGKTSEKLLKRTIIVASSIILVFFVSLHLPPHLARFSRVFAQFAGIAVLIPDVKVVLSSRITFGDRLSTIVLERYFWVGIGIAVMLSMLAYISREALITGGSLPADLLLANALLAFGGLKLLLFRELRQLEKYYLSDKFPIAFELFGVIVISFVILFFAELATYIFSNRLKFWPNDGHLQAFFFVVILSMTALVGSKLLVLFKERGAHLLWLIVIVFAGFMVILYEPNFSLPIIFLVYIITYRTITHG